MADGSQELNDGDEDAADVDGRVPLITRANGVEPPSDESRSAEPARTPSPITPHFDASDYADDVAAPRRMNGNGLKLIDLVRTPAPPAYPGTAEKVRRPTTREPHERPARHERAGGYLHLDAGDWEPRTGRRVEIVIAKLPDRVVYLDQNLFVRWDHLAGALPDGAFRLFDRVAAMESVPLDYLPPEQRRAYHRLLGEAVARLVVDESVGRATAALDAAEAFAVARRNERSRLWYLTTSVLFAGGVAGAGGLAWALRGVFGAVLGPATFVGLLGMAAAGVGGFASIALRVERMALEPAAGEAVHKFDCAMRLFVSTIAGGAVCLAAHSVLALAASALPAFSMPLPVLILAAAAAGFAERLVPSLVIRPDAAPATAATAVAGVSTPVSPGPSSAKPAERPAATAADPSAETVCLPSLGQ